MDKSRWVVKSEYVTREECEAKLREFSLDPDDYQVEDFEEIEIGIIREGHVPGQRLYTSSWRDIDRIVLFDDHNFDNPATKEDIEWCEKVAKVICEALNKADL